MLKIRDLIDTKGNEIWSISPDQSAYAALEIMAEKNIGALIVIDKGKVAGIFSERDYARKVILKGKASRDTAVRDLMTAKVYAIAPEKTAEECMALMSAAHVRHMPVMDGQVLLGFVSMGDIVKAVLSSKDMTIQDLERYITGS